MSHTYDGIIFDIDNTAVPTGALSVESQRLLNAFHALPQDIHAIPATGRSYATAKPILDSLHLNGPAIVANGALILEAQSGEVIHASLLSKHTVSRLLTLVRGNNVYLAECGMMVPKPAPEVRATETPALYVTDMTEDAAEQLLLQVQNIEGISGYICESAINKSLRDVNVNHADASKATAIEYITHYLGIDPRRLIGIGDWVNDMPIFEHVGLKVAMGNGHPELIARADLVAPTLAEDGLAHTVEMYLLK